eukprot:127910-Pleurochrysis_carterae.AAC.5
MACFALQAQLGAQQQASFCGGTRKFQMEFVYGGIPETANISDTFGDRKWTNAEYPSILQASCATCARINRGGCS